jgi:ABC-type lipoprotein export system ATPase subunit
MDDPLLDIKGVYKSYWRGPHEVVVLADVSLHVCAGELAAIWGRRGAGKTTLARVAAGLETPDEGSVRFAGQDLATAQYDPGRLLHKDIAWMRRSGPRSSEFGSVLDYVVLPLLSRYPPRRAQRHALGLLKRLGVAECARASWKSTTDGERTLIALAHALAREPRLLIADDPIVNLDMLQREEVMGLLRRVVDEENLGALIVVPDMPQMACADRVGSLSDGRLLLSKEPVADRTNVIDFPEKQSA